MVRARFAQVLVGPLLALGCASIVGLDEEPSLAGGAGSCGVGQQAVTFQGRRLCVDVREVSRRQWAEFQAVAATLGPWLPEGGACAARRSTAPSAAPPAYAELDRFPDTDLPDVPVVNVDYCDALAYCTWRGKRPCHGDVDHWQEAARDEWTYLCTSDGRYELGYGTAADEDHRRCSGIRRVSDTGCFEPPTGDPWCEATPVTYVSPGGGCTAPSAPFAGLYDLVGNVWEWTDACYEEQGVTRCLTRGGSFGSEYEDDAAPGPRFYPIGCLRARQPVGRDRPGLVVTTRDADLGIRCCQDR